MIQQVQTSTEEKKLLSCILADPSVLDEVGNVITPNHFAGARERKVYDAMIGIGPSLDVELVINAMRSTGNLAGIGEEYVQSLAVDTVSSARVSGYVDGVVGSFVVRRLKEIAKGILSSEQPPSDSLDCAVTELMELSTNTVSKTSRQMRDVVPEVLQQVLAGEVEPGIPTGFTSVDRDLMGLQGGDMVVIGARPSQGKTAFAMNIAVNAAKLGKRVMVFSLEMSEHQLIQRIIASETGVIFKRIAQGYLSNTDRQKIEEATPRLLNLPIIIDDDVNFSMTAVRTKARREQALRGLDMLILDYIQIAVGDDRQELTDASRGIKLIAKQLNVPFIALSQLSRGVESRESARPRMADFRGSGGIEADADKALGIWTPRDDGTKTIEILKNRNGPLGSCDLLFNGDIVRFEDPMNGGG